MNAVVIGLSAGHRIRDWLSENPVSTAVVIDSRPELVPSFLSLLGEGSERVDVVILDSLDALRSHGIMSVILNESPPVFFDRTSEGVNQGLLESFFGFCTGRSLEGLRFHLKSLGIDASEEIGVQDNGRYLTVKQLGLVVDSQHPDHPQAPLIRVLKELIV